MAATRQSKPIIAITCYRLRVAAWAHDGSVEALEDPAMTFAVGVLWHPEEGEDARLFADLVAIPAAPSRFPA